MVVWSQETWDELPTLFPAVCLILGSSPREIKPQVSGIPLGSDNPGAGRQPDAWDTLRGGLSPSFCSLADCVLVGVGPAVRGCVVSGVTQSSVF